MAEKQWGTVPWKLAHRDTEEAGAASAVSVTVDGRAVHLRRLGEADWCAAIGECIACGGIVRVSTADSDPPELRCDNCQAQWPMVVGGSLALPCMVVDNEVYVLLDEQSLGC